MAESERTTDELDAEAAEAALADVLAGPDGHDDAEVRARASALAEAILDGRLLAIDPGSEPKSGR